MTHHKLPPTKQPTTVQTQNQRALQLPAGACTTASHDGTDIFASHHYVYSFLVHWQPHLKAQLSITFNLCKPGQARAFGLVPTTPINGNNCDRNEKAS
jgi:hypothetical protein